MRRQFRWIAVAAALMTLCVGGSPAMAIGYLSGVLQKPAYVQALTSLLDKAPTWTREVLKPYGAYTSSSSITTDIDGITYTMFVLCVRGQKCSDTAIVLMFAPNGSQVWGGLYQKGEMSYLGAPSDAQQAVLKRELYLPSPVPVTGPYLYEVIKKQPAYARTLNQLLDHADKLPPWAQGMGKGKGWSVEAPVTHVVIEGITYDLFFACESQNCDLSQLTVMFAPNATQAWGVLYHEGAISYLGAPSAAQQWAMRETLGDRSGK